MERETLLILIPIILALLSLKFLRKRNLHKHGVRERKYPPIAGTMFHQLLNFNRLHHYMTDLAAKYKTYRLLAPFRNEVYTSDPANVEYILKTNFDNYGKGDYNYGNLTDLLGDGIFVVDGEKWRNQRKVASYEFSTRVLRDFSSKIFGDNVVKLANIISHAANSNQIIDIQDLFMKSTLDSIFKVGFGVDLDSTCESNDEGERFGQAFDDASALSMYRYVDVLWPIKKFLNIGSEAKLKKNVRIVDAFVYKLINNKVELMKNSQGNFSDPKICFSDDILPDGYSVSKGDVMSYQPYAMARMKFIWGDDAEEFRPERWLSKDGIFQPESPFKFTTFQAGPRVCLGKEFAYRQMKIFSAVLVNSFIFKLGDENDVVNYRTMITLQIDGGLHVRAFPRK